MEPSNFIKQLQKWESYKQSTSPYSYLSSQDLINTIISYAESGFSLRATARNMNVHVNSIIYRFKIIESETTIKNDDYKFFLKFYCYMKEEK